MGSDVFHENLRYLSVLARYYTERRPVNGSSWREPGLGGIVSSSGNLNDMATNGILF